MTVGDYAMALFRTLLILAGIVLLCVMCWGIGWVLAMHPEVFFIGIGVVMFGLLFIGQLNEVRDKD